MGALRQDLIDAVEDAMSLGGSGEGLPEDDDIALFNELVSELREEFAEMAERLFLDVGLNKREAKEFVDAFFEVVRDALEKGEQVKLSGFGNFDLRFKNQRPGRNPKTGVEIPISARRVVTFRPGQKLKVRVEAYAGSGQQ